MRPRRRATAEHGIGFDEACCVFSDADGLLIADPDNSGKEERFLLLGMSYRWRARTVRAQYDFSAASRNPYVSQVRKTISIRLDERALGYFKDLGQETGVPYQSLINMYLMECAAEGKRPRFRKAS